jgi:hypothetical protein
MEKEILDALKGVINYRARPFKLPKSERLPPEWEPERSHLGDRYYSYVINHWIPKQPDSSALMKLFIPCDFDLIRFARLIIDPGPGTRTRKAA